MDSDFKDLVKFYDTFLTTKAESARIAEQEREQKEKDALEWQRRFFVPLIALVEQLKADNIMIGDKVIEMSVGSEVMNHFNYHVPITDALRISFYFFNNTYPVRLAITRPNGDRGYWVESQQFCAQATVSEEDQACMLKTFRNLLACAVAGARTLGDFQSMIQLHNEYAIHKTIQIMEADYEKTKGR